MKSCCAPSRAPLPFASSATDAAHSLRVPQFPTREEFVLVDALTFTMGTNSREGFVEDGEGPERKVSLSRFEIDRTTVTNAMFACFVESTGYVTEAQRRGSSYVFHLQLANVPRGASMRPVAGLPWWLDVDGANWIHPEGPGSHIGHRESHPVVHVSWNDAEAFCHWQGTALPTEAQWECAARGGLEAARYPWGDDLGHEGRDHCNIWHGRFPDAPSGDWTPGTVAADSYAPNAYGLFNTAGNVWEWCADEFDPLYHLTTASRDPRGQKAPSARTMKGGSFLCHESYCNRYRLAARSMNSPSTSTSHIGFRVCRQA